MKKLISIVLSTAMILSMFSAAIAVSAAGADEGGYIHPDTYDGIFPQSSAGVFGFEESGIWGGWAEGGTNSFEIDSDAATGKGSMKLTFSESSRRILAATTGDLSGCLKAGADYFVTAKVKASADFDGKIDIRFVPDMSNMWASVATNWYTGETYFLNCTGSEFACNGTVKQTKEDLSDWQTVRSFDIMPCLYNLGDNNKLAAAWKGDNAGLVLIANGSKGTVWIDDISLDYDGNYNGSITKDAEPEGRKNGNGGFEDDFDPWIVQAALNTEAVGSGKNRSLTKTEEAAHTGRYSGKFIKETESDFLNPPRAYGGFELPVSSLNSEKDSYIEMWVKVEDDFNGALGMRVGNPYGNCITVDYVSELYMLGRADDFVKGTEIRDGWILLRTPVIPAAAVQAYKDSTSDTNALLMLEFYGTGTVYIDDFDWKTVEEDTPRFTPNWPNPHSVFQQISIVTDNTDTDIYYTLDGSDPRYSNTAKLYDSAKPLVLGEEIYINAAALNRTTGLFGNVVGSHYKSVTTALELALDSSAASTAVGNVVNLVSQNDYKLSFDLVTSGLTGNEITAKLFLVGYGTEKLTVGDQTLYGAWADRKGYACKTTADGTLRAEVSLTGMDEHYTACVPVLTATGSTGTAEIKNVSVATVQHSKPAVSVAENDNPYLNYYFDGETVEKSITVTNNTAYIQFGTLNYTVTAYDNTVVDSGTIDIEGLEKDTSDTWMIEILNADKFGAYTVTYSYYDASGKESTAGTTVFARVKDNSGIIDDIDTGISSHVMGWGAKTDAEYDTMFETYAKIGLKYLRIDAYWNQVETVKGTYSIPEHWLRIVNSAVKNGLEPIVIINGIENELYKDDTLAVRAQAFASYAAQVVSAMPSVKYVECINEYNLSGAAADYAVILRAFHAAVKGVRSNINVIAGNVSNHGGNYLQQMAAADSAILDCMDIWSVHPYSLTWSADSSYEGINETLYKQSFAELKSNYLDAKGIKLWAGEFGYAVCDTVGGVDSATSANYTARAYMAMEASGIDKVIQYTVDGGVANYYTESNFGILDTDNKDTSVAINAYNAVMDGYRLAEKISDGTYGKYVYRFTNGSDDMYALWTTGGSAEYQLTFAEENRVITDVYGNKTEAAAAPSDNGFIYTVAMSGSPVYLTVGAFVPEPLQYNNVKKGDFENGEAGFYSDAGHSLDDKVVYDGNYSQKLDFDAQQRLTMALDINTEGFDVSKRYYLQFKARGSADYSGKFVPTVKVVREGSDPFHIWSDWYNGDFYAIGSGSENASIPTTWQNYTTPSFYILGDDVVFEINASATGGKLWLDNFEMIPVEGTGSENGIVTSRWDSASKTFVLTAKANEGYKVDAMTVKVTVPYELKEVSTEITARPSVGEASYSFSLDGYTPVAREDYGQFCTAQFSPAEKTLAGDCNSDSSVNILDLVRAKKYLADLTYDIELVNIDYDNDGFVDTTDLTSLKKQLLGIN